MRHDATTTPTAPALTAAPTTQAATPATPLASAGPMDTPGPTDSPALTPGRPSSVGLIDGAIAAGRIDAQTAALPDLRAVR